MPSMTDPKLLEELRETLRPLTGASDDYDRIMDLVGDEPAHRSEWNRAVRPW